MASPVVCVLAGSPRRSGASSALAVCLARGVQEAGGTASVVRLADFAIEGCIGCGACEATGRCVLRVAGDRPGFGELEAAVDAADGLLLAAPLYFAGPCSQLKAFFDRQQPLWAQRYLLGTRPVRAVEERRPWELFVLGGGGDPFGYEPLVTCGRSALRMLDYELRGVHDCVGYGAGRGLSRASADADAAIERAAAEAARAFVRDLRPWRRPAS